MTAKRRIRIAGVVSLFLSSMPCWATDRVWEYNGFSVGHWDTPENWSGGIVPNSGDDVLVLRGYPSHVIVSAFPFDGNDGHSGIGHARNLYVGDGHTYPQGKITAWVDVEGPVNAPAILTTSNVFLGHLPGTRGGALVGEDFRFPLYPDPNQPSDSTWENAGDFYVVIKAAASSTSRTWAN